MFVEKFASEYYYGTLGVKSMYISNFQDLLVWQKSHQLVRRIYSEVRLPQEERYGLESQIRRAAVSVPANIAEGCSRRHNKELIHFLNIALGSLNEVKYYVILCRDLSFISVKDYESIYQLCVEVDKMLNSLSYKLRNKE